MNTIGITISLIHLCMIIATPTVIIFSSNKNLLLTLFVCINISYFLNIYYKNCILTLVEKKYNNIAIIDLFGKFIPQFKGTLKDCNIMAATMILMFNFFCFLKLVKVYYTKKP